MTEYRDLDDIDNIYIGGEMVCSDYEDILLNITKFQEGGYEQINVECINNVKIYNEGNEDIRLRFEAEEVHIKGKIELDKWGYLELVFADKAYLQDSIILNVNHLKIKDKQLHINGLKAGNNITINGGVLFTGDSIAKYINMTVDYSVIAKEAKIISEAVVIDSKELIMNKGQLAGDKLEIKAGELNNAGSMIGKEYLEIVVIKM